MVAYNRSTKFQGNLQIIILALSIGAAYSYCVGGSNIINSIMMNEQQIAISGTMFGLAASVWGLTQGPFMPLIAGMVKRLGAKKCIIFGEIVTIGTCLGLSNLIVNDISYIIIYGGVLGFATCFTSQIPPNTIVNSWFHWGRGRALAIFRAITMLFNASGPLVATWFIALNGGDFKFGWYMMGIWGIVGLVIAFFLKEKPEDVGQKPDGVASDEDIARFVEVAKKSTVFKQTDENSVMLNAARKKGIFWLMAFGSAIGFMTFMTIAYVPVHFMNFGFDMSVIALAQTVCTIGAIVTTVILAPILDKVEPAIVFGVLFAFCAIVSLFTANPTGNWNVYLMMLALQLLLICDVTIMPAIIANYFGMKDFPAISGIILLIGGLLSCTTGVVGGLIYDTTGTYGPAFIVYGLIALIMAIIFVLFIGIPSHKMFLEQKRKLEEAAI